MKNEMKMIAVLALLASFSGAVQAKDVYIKESDKSVVLTLKDDQTATITKLVDDERVVLAEGKLTGEAPTFVIPKNEEGVCPPVSVILEKEVAKVRDMNEEASNDLRGFCSERNIIIDGRYRHQK